MHNERLNAPDSSLVHLQRLPAHTLKIDTSFARAMLENDNDRDLVKGIVGLGHAQGYGIAKPMSAEEFSAWIDRYVVPGSWCRELDPVPAVLLDEVAGS